MKLSVILLAGGKGVRMGKSLPKQFLPLQARAIALHSLEVFLQLKEVAEIIVVCAPEYRHFFSNQPVSFALPGIRRQDSLYNGLKIINPSSEWVCTHDAARPFITTELVKKLLKEGKETEAVSLALPVKNTLKEVTSCQTVTRTLDRNYIWEIQTPQLIKKNIIQEGFDYVNSHALTVTDDISLAECIGKTVKLIPGSYQNIKITTPEDLLFAEWLIQTNTACTSPMMEPAIMDGKFSQMASPYKV